jgi:hypothetical protein
MLFVTFMARVLMRFTLVLEKRKTEQWAFSASDAEWRVIEHETNRGWNLLELVLAKINQHGFCQVFIVRGFRVVA